MAEIIPLYPHKIRRPVGHLGWREANAADPRLLLVARALSRLAGDKWFPLTATGVGVLVGIIVQQNPVTVTGQSGEQSPVASEATLASKESLTEHPNLIGATFQAKALDMFAPSLEVQAKQGGATLLGITQLPPEQQIIPVEQVGFIKRRVLGPNAELFPAYEVIGPHEREIRAIAVARTINNATNQPERYFLLSDPCLVHEMPSNEYNRQLLDVFPAALDTRTKILFPQECWVMERTAPYDWINSANSSSPSKLPSTGRDSQ